MSSNTTVNTTFSALDSDPQRPDDVESPQLSSGNALARFEFEANRSNKDATKVLMVEWEDVEGSSPGEWEISWEGKKTVLPASSSSSEDAVRRLYFLLGPTMDVPTTVELKKGDTISWRTNPLPAIFAPGQGGKKGVLHGIWARERAGVLREEIEEEERRGGEGVGLEMARAEMEWIEREFGVEHQEKEKAATGGSGLGISTNVPPATPTSPRSPGGGRLADKLKGLRLGTSERELSSTPTTPHETSFNNYATSAGMGSAYSKPPQGPQPPAQRKIVAQSPPESFAAQQRQAGMGSLNAFAAAKDTTPSKPSEADDDDDDDDLFALPMSPRSPEMGRSPFSFAAQDTLKYMQGDNLKAA